jgi:hypothetical protein
MFFGGIRKIKFILYTGFIIAALLVFKNIAQTETQTGNINVNMNVPGTTPETPISGGTDYYSPQISNVVSTTDFYSAVITWEVNFNHTGSGNTTTIVYGKDFNYGSSTVVTVSGTLFTTEIENLEADTLYYFKITATNGAPLTAEAYGTFQTQKATILNNLTILAHPEKRVEKAGGNFGVDNATVFFLDQTASTILAEFTTVLEDDGSTIISNITVPEGTALTAVLKTNSHLGKRLNGINTTEGDLTLDFTESNSFYLFAGDMAGDLKGDVLNNSFAEFLQNAKQDEFIDILDISSVVSKFNNQQTGERANLNGDNIVDAQDISIVLSNWNKTGDMMGK